MVFGFFSGDVDALNGLSARELTGSFSGALLGDGRNGRHSVVPLGIEQITLFIFGGVAHIRKEAPTPRAELLIALAGPAVSFALGAVCLGLVVLGESLQSPPALQGLII
jgi:Zn-dependent protease